MTDIWKPGNLYSPGDIVQPRLTDPLVQDSLNNPDFEAGDTGWDTAGSFSITSGDAFQGTFKAAFSAGILMAIASADDDDNFATSSDAVTFTPDSMDPTVIFMNSGPGLAYSDTLDKWVVSDLILNKLYESTNDGGDWVEISTTGAPPLGARGIKWISGLNKFFSGEALKIRSSSDGIAWTLRSTITGSSGEFAYDPTGNILLATGADGTKDIMRSTDGGLTFTGVEVGQAITGIIWASGAGTSGLFMGLEPSSFDVMTSPDGLIWTIHVDALPAGIIGGPHKVTYSPTLDRFMVVSGAAPSAAFSDDDGATWTNATTVPAGPLNWVNVQWDPQNEVFVACEEGGGSSSFMTSPNGVTWTERTTTTTGLGGWAALLFGGGSIISSTTENTGRLTVEPGQQITAQVFAKITGSYSANVGITWHGAGDVLLSTDFGDSPIVGTSSAYRRVSATATAPQDALTASVVLRVTSSGESVFFDNVTISHTNPLVISKFLFKAVQAAAGFSDSFEPVWPTVIGNTVVDNEVTWETIAANRVVWKAVPILFSGPIEPTFPATPDGEVADNTISWKAITRRVEDENCPNTKEVAIEASKVFAGDKDIIAFSATINPLDWTTTDDAGFIPYGLNTYGSQDVSALSIYRSNIVAFNATGFQMWQVDEDPANFAILDAIPVGCPFHRSIQPVSNDLVFLTEVGIRSMGIAGASTNLEAGSFGKQIDPLVKIKLDAGEEPISLYYPGQGQYWLIFGAEAFVLTMNGGKSEMSWSRYVFPSSIDDWTILNKDLILRSGDKIWRISENAERDDQVGDPATSGTAFVGKVEWPYLDFGRFGGDKQMIGFDLVATGTVKVTFGYDQTDFTKVTDDFTLSAGDTLPGTIVPMPITAPSFQLRLEFAADQNVPWEWSSAILYIEDIGT